MAIALSIGGWRMAGSMARSPGQNPGREADMTNVHTVNDLLNTPDLALQARDSDTLVRLIQTVEGWMQAPQERLAQMTLLNAMLEAVEELESV